MQIQPSTIDYKYMYLLTTPQLRLFPVGGPWNIHAGWVSESHVAGFPGSSLVPAASAGWFRELMRHRYFYLLLLLLFFSSFSLHGGDISWMCEGYSGSVFVRYVIVAVVSDICVATTDDCWPTCMAGHFLDTFKYYEPLSPGLQRPLGAPHIVGRLRGIAPLFNLL